MILYRAAWVLPISGPPIRNGGVLTRDARVVAVSAAFDEGRGLIATDAADSAARSFESESDTHIETKVEIPQNQAIGRVG